MGGESLEQQLQLIKQNRGSDINRGYRTPESDLLEPKKIGFLIRHCP
jgi:hypothetical protein